MVRYFAFALALSFPCHGQSLPEACTDRIETANAWLAIAGLTGNISDRETVCKDANNFASSKKRRSSDLSRAARCSGEIGDRSENC